MEGDFVRVPLGPRIAIGVVWGNASGEVHENKLKDISKKHFYLSISKSLLRLVACYVLWMTNDVLLMYIGVLFGLAEILGIAEEI